MTCGMCGMPVDSDLTRLRFPYAMVYFHPLCFPASFLANEPLSVAPLPEDGDSR